MTPVEPILVSHLFPELHAELLTLLRGLRDQDWDQPTAARAWCVKDVVAHLLDGDIRRLSVQRDHSSLPEPELPIEGYGNLVTFLNQLNADWVQAARRISPRLLVEFLALTGPQVAQLFQALDPQAPALWPVAWAGDETSPNWFDVAREYTERWHHQQQIRDAVGVRGLTSRRWLYPVLETFFMGLPHTYRAVEAATGTHITFEVSGAAGGAWTLAREGEVWRLYAERCPEAGCHVRMDQDTAWRLMTKGLSSEEAASRVHIAGEQHLGIPVLKMLAVMA
jgi:uncharacterized protein (TIGR03083 family)